MFSGMVCLNSRCQPMPMPHTHFTLMVHFTYTYLKCFHMQAKSNENSCGRTYSNRVGGTEMESFE